MPAESPGCQLPVGLIDVGRLNLSWERTRGQLRGTDPPSQTKHARRAVADISETRAVTAQLKTVASSPGKNRPSPSCRLVGGRGDGRHIRLLAGRVRPCQAREYLTASTASTHFTAPSRTRTGRISCSLGRPILELSESIHITSGFPALSRAVRIAFLCPHSREYPLLSVPLLAAVKCLSSKGDHSSAVWETVPRLPFLAERIAEGVVLSLKQDSWSSSGPVSESLPAWQLQGRAFPECAGYRRGLAR